MNVAIALALAVVCGAAWRRWWGDERPAWARAGYRASQVLIGICALAAICVVAGHPAWAAPIRAALAIGFLTAMAESIPHIWRGWELVDEHLVSLRSRCRLLDGYTTWAELTCGAAVWTIAILV